MHNFQKGGARAPPCPVDDSQSLSQLRDGSSDESMSFSELSDEERELEESTLTYSLTLKFLAMSSLWHCCLFFRSTV